jgi:glycosyltransferase involved in cell wall biosynthesis
MIKLIYDYQIFGWQKYGGISRYIYEIANQIFDLEDFDVKILAMAYVNEYLKQSRSGFVIGLPVPKIPKTGNLIKHFSREISKIWLGNNPPDIIHETYYQSQQLAPKSTKVVITVHDMLHEKFSQFFPNSSLPEEKAKAVQRADHIICVSENTKKDLMEILNVEPSKVSVVYHGISFEPNKNESLSPKNTEPYIFYIGDRGGHKNFQCLLQAYINSSQIKNNFKLLCFGGPPFSDEEINLFNTLGLSEDRILRVSGNDSALSGFYKGASVFVYPSLYEGFGIPLLEAMAFGCPVVCSNTSSIPEVAGSAAELFDPYNWESLVQALEQVLFSDQRANTLVELGTARIKQFSWHNSARQTSLIYSSLV